MTVNAPLLVLVDHDVDGELTGPSAQALTAARTLATEAIALSMTAADLDAIGRYGVARVLTVDTQGLSPRLSHVVADAVRAALRETGAAGVVMTSHYLGREVAARIAVTVGATPIVDVTRLWEEDGTIHASKPALAGAWEVDLHVEDGPIVLAVRPGVTEESEAPVSAVAESLSVEFSAAASGVKVIESTPQERTGRTPLPEARTVVVAGRGTEGDMAPVEALADMLDAAIGATRVVTDEGWAPRSLQVGQTGVNISPHLYIGLGVSGAIHHTVGMQSSRHIVAVVDDPDAPILELADFAVVGDLFEVVPQAIEALKAAGYTA